MSILDHLKAYISQHDLVKTTNKLLLAVSGGKDSMLMAKLFHDLGYSCQIAHCNFQLRDEESDLDEQLVRRYAQELGFPIHVKRFNTADYAVENKISIQMAARELRYAWFEDLRVSQNLDYIAIAQHQNDHLETVLLNLTRSTGLKGLLGIAPKRDVIIRPLLGFTADEVADAVKQLQVPFRDDQSNFSTKYARNKIRLDIIPKFKEIQPDFEQILSNNIQHFEDSYHFIQRIVDEKRKALFKPKGQAIHIAREGLSPFIEDDYFLFELFKPFGFQKSILKEMTAVWDKPMGQVFEADQYEMLMDRDQLLLRHRSKSEKKETIQITNLADKYSCCAGILSFQANIDFVKSSNLNQVQVDADLIKLPLSIRTWEKGDWFIPLGMQGKKKISDFYIQQKVNRFEKEEVPILCNGDGEIIWIIGQRLDNRFKVTENTKKVLTLVFY